MYNVAVLTISDRCSRGESEDQSGKIIIEIIKSINGKIVQYDIVQVPRLRAVTPTSCKRAVRRAGTGACPWGSIWSSQEEATTNKLE